MKKIIIAALFIGTLALGAYGLAQTVGSKAVSAQACDSSYCV